MLVVEINGLDPQSFQAGFARSANIIRFAIDSAILRISGITDDAELRSQHNLVTFALNCAPHQFFIFIRAINVGCVEKSNSQIESAVNRGDGFVVVASAVKLRHTHAAQAEGRDFETAASKFAKLHMISSPRAGSRYDRWLINRCE